MKHILSVMTSYCWVKVKLRQRPDMTIAVDWNVKHKFKQTEKGGFIRCTMVLYCISVYFRQSSWKSVKNHDPMKSKAVGEGEGQFSRPCVSASDTFVVKELCSQKCR